MRKIYAVIITFTAILLTTSLFAQRKFVAKKPILKRNVISTISSENGTTADCDTIDLTNDWSETAYYASSDPDDGYLTGTNAYDDKQKANFYSLGSTSYTYITGVMVDFFVANSSNSSNLSKTVSFKVYDGTSGVPGTLLGTAQKTLAEIKQDVDAVQLTEITFATAISIPSSKKMFVSVDFSTLSWPTDTLLIASNDVDEDIPGKAWEQWSDNDWYSFIDFYGANLSLWVFPIVSTSSTGCSTLPVKLLSFNAQRNNKDVTLNWQIAEEYNMKGYEVQRADNNGIFKTVQSVTALNYAKNQSYTVIDRNAFSLSSTVQYRLKQIDGDGSVKYSRVVAVKANGIISDVTFANPFNGALKLQLNLAASQKISVQVYDMQGKPVVSQLNKMYNASTNSIVLDGTAALKPGMYMLKINAGTEQIQYKIIKQ